MSLVNDLLIEAERRRSATGRRRVPSTPLDDLVPVRPRSRRRDARASRRLPLAFGLVGTIGLGLAIAPLAIRFVERLPARAKSTPPPVAARRAESDAAAPSASPATPRSTATRPVQVGSIALERLANGTQVRVVCDGRTSHRFERDDATGRLELVLSGAALVETAETGEPLDLLATPIRSLDVRGEASDLHLLFTLDPDVRVQTRWLDVPGGAALVLDLQPPMPLAQDDGPAAIDPSLPADTPADAAATKDSLALEPAFEDEWADAAPAFDAADRVVSPSLGDPAALRIERSERDRVRLERAAARAAIAEALGAARRARADGHLDEADARYAEVARLAPEDWTAVCEWADLLVARERPGDALALVERARRRAPRHQGLLITHARLLEANGELEGALALLDGAGLALTEAPDVHALAAAYHQRAGDHAAAIERYEQLLRRFPEESRSWMGLGISLEAVGRREEARDVYRISLQVGELPRPTRRWIGTRIVALGEGD